MVDGLAAPPRPVRQLTSRDSDSDSAPGSTADTGLVTVEPGLVPLWVITRTSGERVLALVEQPAAHVRLDSAGLGHAVPIPLAEGRR